MSLEVLDEFSGMGWHLMASRGTEEKNRGHDVIFFG